MNEDDLSPSLKQTLGKWPRTTPESRAHALKLLQEEHPAVFAEVFELGAQQERARIHGIAMIVEHTPPGYEAIIEGMMFDGKSFAQDVLLAVNTAERRTLRAQLRVVRGGSFQAKK
jgi:hypothetical protein